MGFIRGMAKAGVFGAAGLAMAANTKKGVNPLQRNTGTPAPSMITQASSSQGFPVNPALIGTKQPNRGSLLGGD